MIFFSKKYSVPLKMFHIGAMGDLVWRICDKKWPARHSRLSTRPPIGKLQVLHLWTGNTLCKI
jgi:hypothetical protein